jgi:hypothetical protein
VPNEYLHKTSEDKLRNEWQKFVLTKSLNKMSASSLEKALGGLI